MIKQAVVKVGSTPSEVSGKKSSMIKEGHALADGESESLISSERALEKKLAKSYTDIKDS